MNREKIILEKINELYKRIEAIEHEILLMKSEYIKHVLSKFGKVEDYKDSIYKNSIGYKVEIHGNNLYVLLIENGKKTKIMLVNKNDMLQNIINKMNFSGFVNEHPLYSITIPFNNVSEFFEELEKSI